MSTLISDGASSSSSSSPLPNNEDPPPPRRTNTRRPSSARASFMQQKLQTALSQAEKTTAELGQSSQVEESRAPEYFHVDRSVARYRSTAAVVSFTEPATAFSYATSFMPGVHFYTFLAAKEAAPPRTARGAASHSNSTSGTNGASEKSGNHANPRLTARKHNLALKLNVPDTILYGETGRAVWIYTDKEGYVQRSTEFSDKQVLDKFAEGSPALANEQHLVVYKEPVTTMAPVNNQNEHGPATFAAQGNQLRLLSLGEVKTLLNGVMAMHKSFALQQFIKCNGSKAFVQRAVYEAGKPPHAWMISNIEPVRDPNAPPSPTPGTAGPQTSPRPVITRSTSSYTIATAGEGSGNSIPLVSRLCTSIQSDKACTFVKLTERGCAAVSELNSRIVRYIEQRLRILIRTFVADFVKDAAGGWWLLQVKAFQVHNKIHPGRVFSLPLKLRLAYLTYRDTVILDEDDDDAFDGDDRRSKQLHRHHRRLIVPLSQRNIHKLVQCKCCLAAYPSSELAFKMTLKMINDMLLRIRSRLHPEKTLPLLSAAFARELPESAVAYESWSVCSFCYAIYERDQQLQRIETKFSAALGLPNSKTVADGLSRIQDRSYTLDPTVSACVMPPQLTLCRLVLVINAIYDIPPELYNAELENARIEAAADEVAEAEGRKRPQRAHASRLYLRINALGYTECIPINPDDIMEASEKAPVGARRRRNSAASSASDDDDMESRDDASDQSEPLSSRRQESWQRLSRSQTSSNQHPPSNNDVNYWLPTNLIRTIPFFAPRTPLQSKLKDTSGITPFLTEDNSVRVQLIRATEPPLQDPVAVAAKRRPRNRRAALVPAAGGMAELVSQMHGPTHSVVLGSTKIRMTQFRSSYVTKIDYYACMAITGEMLNIKGNIGLERVRYVDSKLLTSQHRLRVYNGVFVPDESYTTGDPLSSEWIDCFRASTFVGKRPPPTLSTTVEPVESPPKTEAARRKTTGNQADSNTLRAIRPTSSRASLMDEDEEMDKELEQMIERANLKQQEAHFRKQRGLNPAHPPPHSSEEGVKAASAAAIKQELLGASAGAPAKSASQMAMLLNKPVISPRLELSGSCPERDGSYCTNTANGMSMILPSPRNRRWMWSLVFLINQAHHLQSRERSCSRWECHYTLFGQRRSALERQPVTSRTRSGDPSTSAAANGSASHLDVQFNCTHKFWLAGTTLMVQAYLRSNPALRLHFRNEMYASTRCESEGEFYGVLGLSKLLQTRGFDTTIDILATHDDPTVTPREAAAISRMAPYLSLSVQLSRVAIDPDGALAVNRFVELGCIAEGLQVLRKMA